MEQLGRAKLVGENEWKARYAEILDAINDQIDQLIMREREED